MKVSWGRKGQWVGKRHRAVGSGAGMLGIAMARSSALGWTMHFSRCVRKLCDNTPAR